MFACINYHAFLPLIGYKVDPKISLFETAPARDTINVRRQGDHLKNKYRNDDTYMI